MTAGSYKPAVGVEFRTKEGADLYSYYDSLTEMQWKKLFAREWEGIKAFLSGAAASAGTQSPLAGRGSSSGLTFGG